MQNYHKKAIILISGGIDSTTTLAIAKSQGFECHCLSFDYNQKHKIELRSAKAIVKKIGAKSHSIFKLDINQFGGSALTDSNIKIPAHKDNHEIPITYVPARNIIFLSIALGLAEMTDALDIFYGATQIDYSGYPDCRPDFISAFEKMAQVGTKKGSQGEKFQVHAPLLNMSKAEVIKTGMQLNIDYSMTLSCYDPDNKGRACGLCDACHYRQKGFSEANILDPTLYII